MSFLETLKIWYILNMMTCLITYGLDQWVKLFKIPFQGTWKLSVWICCCCYCVPHNSISLYGMEENLFPPSDWGLLFFFQLPFCKKSISTYTWTLSRLLGLEFLVKILLHSKISTIGRLHAHHVDVRNVLTPFFTSGQSKNLIFVFQFAAMMYTILIQEQT